MWAEVAAAARAADLKFIAWRALPCLSRFGDERECDISHEMRYYKFKLDSAMLQ